MKTLTSRAERRKAERNRAEIADHVIAIFENPETPDELGDALLEALADTLPVPSSLFQNRDMLIQMLAEYRPGQNRR